VRGAVLTTASARSVDEPIADRRVRRTRAALQRAIVELVLEKGYGAITGDDIAERADVTRATFYKHYPNKEELLAEVAERFAADVIAAFEHRAPGASRMVPLLEQARRSRGIARVILSGEGDGLALRRFAAIVEQILRDDLRSGTLDPRFADIDEDLLVRLRAAQVLAAVSWFIEHDDADATETARAVTRVIEQGWRRRGRQ
jgi:AcrR family transcriptional regulator